MLSENILKSIREVFNYYGELIGQDAKDALAAAQKNASYDLSDSFNYKIVVQDETVTLNIYAEEYLKYLENKKSWKELPNIRKIVQWIEYKGFEDLSKTGTRHGVIESQGVRSRPGIRRGNSVIIRRNVGVSNERFAFAIARNIMKFGNKPVPILTPIVENLEKEVSERLLTAVKGAIEKDFTQQWKEGPDTTNLTYKIST